MECEHCLGCVSLCFIHEPCTEASFRGDLKGFIPPNDCEMKIYFLHTSTMKCRDYLVFEAPKMHQNHISTHIFLVLYKHYMLLSLGRPAVAPMAIWLFWQPACFAGPDVSSVYCNFVDFMDK